MAQEASEETEWYGISDSLGDPEETKVIFCALDSFL
jgi:hypothetical protein